MTQTTRKATRTVSYKDLRPVHSALVCCLDRYRSASSDQMDTAAESLRQRLKETEAVLELRPRKNAPAESLFENLRHVAASAREAVDNHGPEAKARQDSYRQRLVARAAASRRTQEAQGATTFRSGMAAPRSVRPVGRSTAGRPAAANDNLEHRVRVVANAADLADSVAPMLARFNARLARLWLSQPANRVELAHAFAAGLNDDPDGDPHPAAALALGLAYQEREARLDGDAK
jgi:hypothetical protein